MRMHSPFRMGEASDSYVILYKDGDIAWKCINKWLADQLREAKNANKSSQIA